MDNRKKWTLFDTCTYYFMKLIGLCPFKITRDNAIKKSRIGLFYNVSMSILYTYSFNLAIRFRKAIILWEETPIAVIIDIIGSILSYLVLTTSWLTVACRQKAALELIESFREIDQLRKKLRVINAKTSLLDLQNRTMFWFLYNLPRNIFFIIPFIMSKIMFSFREQSNLLNRELLVVFKNNQPNRAIERLESLAELHASLIDLYERVVNYFGLPILIILLCSLSEVILPIHGIWQILNKLNWGVIDNACIIYNPSIKFLSHAIVIYFVCSVPHSTCLQINKTVVTVHRLWNENEEAVDRKKMKQIILRFSQTQLKTRIFGFLHLDHNLFKSFSSIVCIKTDFV